MEDTEVRQRSWVIGTFAMNGHRIPIVEIGTTREEARARAREALERVWTALIEREKSHYAGTEALLESIRQVLYRDDETAAL
jgi:hypothetical protein